MGRLLNPGEESYGGILSPYSAHDRVLRASLASVDSYGGFATLDLLMFPSTGRYASIPWIWASFPVNDVDTTDVPKTRKGAWGRYMPFKDDLVKVSYDFDDTPHILGYDALGALDRKTYSAGDGRAGWSAISQGRDNGVIHPNFRDLKSGEYDFMSVGGAYIFGADNGDLLLQSGTTQATLSVATDDIDVYTGQYRLNSLASRVRFGSVRRESPPNSGQYTSFGPWNLAATGQEFDVSLATTRTGADRINVARFAIGNLATEFGIEQLSTTFLQKMAALELYDITGFKVWELGIDAVGSMLYRSDSAMQYDVMFGNANSKFTYASSSTSVSFNYDVSCQEYTFTTISGARTAVGARYEAYAPSGMSLTTDTGFNVNAATVSLSAATNLSITGSTSISMATSVLSMAASGAASLTGSSVVIGGGSVSLAAPSISIGAPSPSAPSGGVVALGPTPTGGALNGTILSAALAAVDPVLLAALASATTLNGVTTPINGTAVAPILLQIISYLQALSVGVPASTSSTVTI